MSTGHGYVHTNRSSADFSSFSALASSALYASSSGRSGRLGAEALSLVAVGVSDFAVAVAMLIGACYREETAGVSEGRGFDVSCCQLEDGSMRVKAWEFWTRRWNFYAAEVDGSPRPSCQLLAARSLQGVAATLRC